MDNYLQKYDFVLYIINLNDMKEFNFKVEIQMFLNENIEKIFLDIGIDKQVYIK